MPTGVVCLPSAAQWPVPAAAALLSAGRRRPAAAAAVAVSSTEAAFGRA